MPWLAPMLTASTFPKPLVQELEVDLFVVICLWACATTRIMYRCFTGQLPAHGLKHPPTLPQCCFLQSDEAFTPIDEPDMMEHDQGRNYDEPELRQVQPA